MKLLNPPGVDPLARHRLLASAPAFWPCWPFLAVVRRCRAEEELGVLFDALGLLGLSGHSSTVFLCNFFELPATVDAMLALPREAHDSADELIDAGWRVD